MASASVTRPTPPRCTPLHQQHIVLHEAGHLLCGHQDARTAADRAAGGGAAGLVPHLSGELVRRVLGRSQEQEAELFAGWLPAAAAVHRAQARGRVLPRADGPRGAERRPQPSADAVASPRIGAGDGRRRAPPIVRRGHAGGPEGSPSRRAGRTDRLQRALHRPQPLVRRTVHPADPPLGLPARPRPPADRTAAGRRRRRLRSVLVRTEPLPPGPGVPDGPSDQRDQPVLHPGRPSHRDSQLSPVAEAFIRSQIVAAVRCRLRTELASPQPGGAANGDDDNGAERRELGYPARIVDPRLGYLFGSLQPISVIGGHAGDEGCPEAPHMLGCRAVGAGVGGWW